MQLTLRNVASCTVRSWMADRSSPTAAALAFYCAFSLAPLLIIILAVAGWIVGETAAFGFVSSQLQMLFGGAMAGVVLDAMKNSQQSEGIGAAILSISTLVIGATTVFAALEEALEKILGGTAVPRSGLHGWVRRRLLSLGFILALSFLLIVSLSLSTVIAGVRSWVLDRYSPLIVVISLLDVVLTLAFMTALFALIYRYMPAQRMRWDAVLAGGMFTAVLFSIGKWAVGLYLARSTVPTAFGAAAAFAALLLWLYYTAMIFLLGAQFTACVGGLKDQPPATSAFPRKSRAPAVSA